MCSIFLEDVNFKNYLIEKEILNTIVVDLFNAALSVNPHDNKIQAPLVVAAIIEDGDYCNVIDSNGLNVNNFISFLNNLRKNYSKKSNCRKDLAFFDLMNIVDYYFGNDN